jgi:ribosomal-protein-serine acetyltransferase
MSWAKETYPLADAEQTVRRLASQYLAGNDHSVGIWEGDLLVGGSGFHLRQGLPEWKNAEIGMWIRASKAGQGLGTQVLAEMLRWGFTEWPWERIVWRCTTTNYGSARVAEKCGLRLEGTMVGESLSPDGHRCDMKWYAVRKTEWLSQR